MSSKVNNQHPAAATTTLGGRDLRSELATAVLLFVQVASALHTAAAEGVSFRS